MEDSGIDSGDHNADLPNRLNGSDSSSSTGSNRSLPRASVVSASRQLQRKLEARLGQVRRHQQEYNNSTTAGLLPIQRVQVPGAKDQQPLVQWDTDDSEEDIVNFFPLSKRKESKVHQELTDTFSIEEMSISGDDDDEEDLHLVPPQTIYRRFKCCPVTFCAII